MSVIRCINNLWLHCVSIGSDCQWLAGGEIPWNQMHICLWVEGRVGERRVERRNGCMEQEQNGTEMDGWMDVGIVGGWIEE